MENYALRWRSRAVESMNTRIVCRELVRLDDTSEKDRCVYLDVSNNNRA